MAKFRISGTGCALVDYLYKPVSFTSGDFRRYMFVRPGDGGLAPGKLVFRDEFEKSSGENYLAVRERITQGNGPVTLNDRHSAVNNCFATGTLIADSALGVPNRLAGFFLGINVIPDDPNNYDIPDNSITFNNCYSTATVAVDMRIDASSSNDMLGSFMADSETENWNTQVNINNCYAAGEIGPIWVDVPPVAGGFLGRASATGTAPDATNLTNCYFDKQLTGMREDGIGFPANETDYGLTGLLTDDNTNTSQPGMVSAFNGGAWIAGAGHYPQLTSFANGANDSVFTDPYDIMVARLNSAVSVSTAFLNVYTEEPGSTGIPFDHDYDTVRDLMHDFDLTEDGDFSITGTTLSWAHENTPDLVFNQPGSPMNVLDLVNKNNPAATDGLFHGVIKGVGPENLIVTATYTPPDEPGTGGLAVPVQASRKIRVIPLMAMDVGPDTVLPIGSTYDMWAPVRLVVATQEEIAYALLDPHPVSGDPNYDPTLEIDIMDMTTGSPPGSEIKGYMDKDVNTIWPNPKESPYIVDEGGTDQNYKDSTTTDTDVKKLFEGRMAFTDTYALDAANDFKVYTMTFTAMLPTYRYAQKSKTLTFTRSSTVTLHIRMVIDESANIDKEIEEPEGYVYLQNVERDNSGEVTAVGGEYKFMLEDNAVGFLDDTSVPPQPIYMPVKVAHPYTDFGIYPRSEGYYYIRDIEIEDSAGDPILVAKDTDEADDPNAPYYFGLEVSEAWITIYLDVNKEGGFTASSDASDVAIRPYTKYDKNNEFGEVPETSESPTPSDPSGPEGP